MRDLSIVHTYTTPRSEKLALVCTVSKNVVALAAGCLAVYDVARSPLSIYIYIYTRDLTRRKASAGDKDATCAAVYGSFSACAPVAVLSCVRGDVTAEWGFLNV